MGEDLLSQPAEKLWLNLGSQTFDAIPHPLKAVWTIYALRFKYHCPSIPGMQLHTEGCLGQKSTIGSFSLYDSAYHRGCGSSFMSFTCTVSPLSQNIKAASWSKFTTVHQLR